MTMNVLCYWALGLSNIDVLLHSVITSEVFIHHSPMHYRHTGAYIAHSTSFI